MLLTKNSRINSIFNHFLWFICFLVFASVCLQVCENQLKLRFMHRLHAKCINWIWPWMVLRAFCSKWLHRSHTSVRFSSWRIQCISKEKKRDHNDFYESHRIQCECIQTNERTTLQWTQMICDVHPIARSSIKKRSDGFNGCCIKFKRHHSCLLALFIEDTSPFIFV